MFARLANQNFVEVQTATGMTGAALQEAVANKLKQDVSPGRIALTVEGTNTPLDSTMTLEEAGIHEKARLNVDVLPAAPTATEKPGAYYIVLGPIKDLLVEE